MKKERRATPPSEQTVVIPRRLAILQRLMRAPASSADLLQIVADHDHDLPPSRIQKRFEEDRKHLREVFGCDLYYNRATDQYELRGMDRALIDLSDESLRGLAFLQTTFSHPEAVNGADVRALIDQITLLLSDARQRELGRIRGIIEVRLQPRDSDDIPEAVWKAIRAACSEKRQLQFEYRSPGHHDGVTHIRIVEPHRYYFDKHYYLDAYCRESSGKALNEWRLYRLGRISNPHVLPSHFTPRRSRRSYELVYELGAEVARMGVSRHFDDQQIFPQDDGSAIVKVQSHDLFSDLRALLHYGPACRVVGGEEAVGEMRKLVEGMLIRYKE
jgi:predicted DNA-binding transcriptional regulator YafY